MRIGFKSKIIYISLIALSLLALLTGCGGGTRGTGIVATKINGSLSSLVENTSIAGVVVTVESRSSASETIDVAQTLTDEQGNFTVSLIDAGNALVFAFSSEEIQSEVRIEDVPEKTSEAQIKFNVSEEKQVSTTSVEFTSRAEPTPSPKPLPLDESDTENQTNTNEEPETEEAPKVEETPSSNEEPSPENDTSDEASDETEDPPVEEEQNDNTNKEETEIDRLIRLCRRIQRGEIRGTPEQIRMCRRLLENSNDSDNGSVIEDQNQSH